MTRKMGIRWHLRIRKAEKGLFQTSDLVLLLAERGQWAKRDWAAHVGQRTADDRGGIGSSRKLTNPTC